MNENNTIQLFEDKKTYRMGRRTVRMVFFRSISLLSERSQKHLTRCKDKIQ